MAPSARWTPDGRRGSDFHEFVVLPTLAPELARDDFIAAGNGQQAPPSTPAGDASARAPVSTAPVLDAALCRQYFVNVTAGKTLSGPNSGKVPKRPPRKEESKPTTREYPILAMSRSEFILAALAAHQLEQSYKPGEHNGPPMRIYWLGSPGGKGNPPLIHTDDEWHALLRQLRAKTSVNTVNVVFDLDEMMPWGRKWPFSQIDDDEPIELSLGTSVPRVDAYNAQQRAVGQAAQDISQHWKCNKHATPCFVDATGAHVQITPIRLKSWSRATAAGTCIASEPPPDELLQEWTGKPLSTPKARGCSGPLSLSAPPTPAVVHGDSGAAVMAAIMPLLTMVVERGLSGTASIAAPIIAPTPTVTASDITVPSPTITAPTAITSDASATPLQAASIVPSDESISESLPSDSICNDDPHRDSSPPPTVHEELTRCLEGFGRARGVPLDIIDDMIGTLTALSYTPDSITVVPVERLRELIPKLEEGQAYSLKNYASTWYDQLVAKHAKRTRYSL